MDDRQTSPRKLILIAAVIAVPSLTAALILLTNLVSAPADARYADGAFSGDLLASTVEIIRDSYGVPHIYGPSDASVVFGAAYAKAEDNWWQVEDNFIRSLGRASELSGEETLLDDYLARALEIPRRSIEEYERAPEHMKTLYDAYAEGFNFFLQAHPEVERRLLTRVEPWHTLALIRFKYHHNEYIGYAGLRRSGTELLLERPDYGPAGEPPTGSNEMAISGSRTASGYPMLLINPHVAFFGLSQYNEVHLESEEGLIFSGLSRYGFMLPYMGHSDFLGWAYTDNYSDIGDVYLERFDDPDNPLQYRYGDDWREAETWPETIRVLTEAGVEERVFDMKKTHHGPVLGVVRDRDGADREAAIRLSKLDEGGWFEQWYGMMRARSHEEWYEAVASLNVPYMNTMYADRDGNIHYLYNAAVPRRSTELDWSEPLNGADTTAEWEGYHSLDELPQVLNPETGYLQNTNSTPLMATEGLTLTRSDFPAYLLGGEGDNHRAQRARQILASLESVTLEEFARAVLDTRMLAADELLPELMSEYEQLGATGTRRPDRLAAAIAELTGWDGVATVESVPATLFVLWVESFFGLNPARREAEGARLASLESALDALERDWDTWQVPWGEINRSQRPDASGQVPFSDDLESLPIPGAPGFLGSLFTFTAPPADGARRRYGVHGNSFVKVVEFGPEISARSILTFGQSGHPDSPHYFDQAPLYAAKRFKPAWFSRSDVEANAERTYRPGEDTENWSASGRHPPSHNLTQTPAGSSSVAMLAPGVGCLCGWGPF